jgi:hypothetical protein
MRQGDAIGGNASLGDLRCSQRAPSSRACLLPPRRAARPLRGRAAFEALARSQADGSPGRCCARRLGEESGVVPHEAVPGRRTRSEQRLTGRPRDGSRAPDVRSPPHIRVRGLRRGRVSRRGRRTGRSTRRTAGARRTSTASLTAGAAGHRRRWRPRRRVARHGARRRPPAAPGIGQASMPHSLRAARERRTNVFAAPARRRPHRHGRSVAAAVRVERVTSTRGGRPQTTSRSPRP